MRLRLLSTLKTFNFLLASRIVRCGAQRKYPWQLFTKNTAPCELVRGCIGGDAWPMPEGQIMLVASLMLCDLKNLKLKDQNGKWQCKISKFKMQIF